MFSSKHTAQPKTHSRAFSHKRVISEKQTAASLEALARPMQIDTALNFPNMIDQDDEIDAQDLEYLTVQVPQDFMQASLPMSHKANGLHIKGIISRNSVEGTYEDYMKNFLKWLDDNPEFFREYNLNKNAIIDSNISGTGNVNAYKSVLLSTKTILESGDITMMTPHLMVYRSPMHFIYSLQIYSETRIKKCKSDLSSLSLASLNKIDLKQLKSSNIHCDEETHWDDPNYNIAFLYLWMALWQRFNGHPNDSKELCNTYGKYIKFDDTVAYGSAIFTMLIRGFVCAGWENIPPVQSNEISYHIYQRWIVHIVQAVYEYKNSKVKVRS